MKNLWIYALVFLFSWFLAYGAVYTGFYVGFGIDRLDALTHFGKTVDGVVAAKRPERHQSIIYYYKVDEIQYTGTGGDGNGNPDFDALQVGDKVIVKYDEHFPLNSYLGLPQYQAQSDRSLAYISSFIISFLLVGQALGIFLIVRYIIRLRGRSTVDLA